jgi:hypothetical protein
VAGAALGFGSAGRGARWEASLVFLAAASGGGDAAGTAKTVAHLGHLTRCPGATLASFNSIEQDGQLNLLLLADDMSVVLFAI